MKNEIKVLDREEVGRILPMTGPALMVSTVVIFDDGSQEFRYYVDPSLDIFHYHFPDRPVLPGHLTIEVMNQACAFAALYPDNQLANRQIRLVKVEGMKLKKEVLPGMTMKVVVNAMRNRGSFVFFEATAMILAKEAEDIEEEWVVAATGRIVGSTA